MLDFYSSASDRISTYLARVLTFWTSQEISQRRVVESGHKLTGERFNKCEEYTRSGDRDKMDISTQECTNATALLCLFSDFERHAPKTLRNAYVDRECDYYSSYILLRSSQARWWRFENCGSTEIARDIRGVSARRTTQMHVRGCQLQEKAEMVNWQELTALPSDRHAHCYRWLLPMLWLCSSPPKQYLISSTTVQNPGS